MEMIKRHVASSLTTAMFFPFLECELEPPTSPLSVLRSLVPRLAVPRLAIIPAPCLQAWKSCWMVSASASEIVEGDVLLSEK
jgi:hypothetical protein